MEMSEIIDEKILRKQVTNLTVNVLSNSPFYCLNFLLYNLNKQFSLTML